MGKNKPLVAAIPGEQMMGFMYRCLLYFIIHNTVSVRFIRLEGRCQSYRYLQSLERIICGSGFCFFCTTATSIHSQVSGSSLAGFVVRSTLKPTHPGIINRMAAVPPMMTTDTMGRNHTAFGSSVCSCSPCSPCSGLIMSRGISFVVKKIPLTYNNCKIRRSLWFNKRNSSSLQRNFVKKKPPNIFHSYKKILAIILHPFFTYISQIFLEKNREGWGGGVFLLSCQKRGK